VKTKYHIVGSIPKSNIKIAERLGAKIDTPGQNFEFLKEALATISTQKIICFGNW
jgi:hypothetical protein